MEVKVFNTIESLNQFATDCFVQQIMKNPQSILGLATGSSPLGLYQGLIQNHQEKQLSFKGIKTFNLDEYFGISKQHPQSYYHFMYENLFKYLDISPQNTHIPNGLAHDISEECSRYNTLLSHCKIDLQVLGIGGNGHIGFNEPYTPFASETHYVQLDEKTRKDNARYFASIHEVPTHAITMGIKNIMAARQIVLIATGLHKAQAVKMMIEGAVTEACPASVLQLHPNCMVLLDHDSSAYLRNKE